MPDYRTFPDNLHEDVEEFRATYNRLLRETRNTPGSGALCVALGWDSDRFVRVESIASTADICEAFLANPYPDATERRPIPRQIRAAVWAMSNGACSYCGCQTNPFDDFTVDHVHPVILGGTDDIENLVPACRSCNARKGARV